jgi:hypothetical protein
VLFASAAFADGTAPPPESEGLPTGAVVQIGLADTAGLTPVTSSSQPVSTNNSTAPIATLRGGAWLAGHSELSIGLAFSYITVDQGGNATTVFEVVAAPTYRYHFTPLKPWALSPFVEVAFLLGIIDENQGFSGAANSSQTLIQLGAQAGIGGEYLFGDRFGVVLSGGVRYLNYTIPNGFSSGGTTVNVVQLWGSAAAALHF